MAKPDLPNVSKKTCQATQSGPIRDLGGSTIAGATQHTLDALVRQSQYVSGPVQFEAFRPEPPIYLDSPCLVESKCFEG
jgi:hypothetical protein